MTVPGAEPAAEGTSWDRQLVCVAGLGVSGPPAARALAARGAQVIVLDSGDDEARRARAAELGRLGIKVLLGSTADDAGLLPGTQLVVTSPGWRPDAPLLAAAARAGVPVIGDVELAWRLRPVLADGTAQAWLGVTGTNGKTTTVKMLAAMLEAAGLPAAAAGNVGTSAVAAVTEAGPYQVLAVELSSFQLHWSTSLRPLAATVLNLAADHIDWHGDLESYARDKARIFAPGTIAVCNADDPWSRRLAAGAAGLSRIVSFRLGPPGPGELGVAAGLLVDRAFGESVALAQVSDVRPAAPHNVANALAAAAVAAELGLEVPAIADALTAATARSKKRMELHERPDGVLVVNDAYNANPDSTRAAIDALAHLTSNGRRGFAVLGYMAELGDIAARSHEEAGERAARAGAAVIVAVGAGAAPVLDGARTVAGWRGEAIAAQDPKAAVEALRNRLRPGDVVLVKASKAAGLWEVADGLLAEVHQ